MVERVTVRWLLTVLIVLPVAGVILPWSRTTPPPPPPTLVGVTPAPGSTGRAITWNGAVVARTSGAGPVAVLPVGPGLAVSTAEDRAAYATLLVHREYARLGPLVTRTAGGWPALELAYGTGDGTWTGVATIVFAPGYALVARCEPRDGRGFDGESLAACAATVDGLRPP